MQLPALDETLVRRLVAEQFPHWGALPVRAIVPGGNDNRTFRLGDELTVRLPSAEDYVAAVEKEQRWLPVIARHVPLPVPEPVAAGAPGSGYPFPWTINRWMPGHSALTAPVDDLARFGLDVARFLRALQTTPIDGAPVAGAHSFWRGADLRHYDEETRRTVAELGGRVDAGAVLAVWDAGLSAPFTGTPVWFHGDVAPGNLLVEDGRLAAVIDFGTSGVGDPACDLSLAWTFLDAPSRRGYREAFGADDGMWARGRAWVLWKALISYDDWGAPVVGELLREV